MSENDRPVRVWDLPTRLFLLFHSVRAGWKPGLALLGLCAAFGAWVLQLGAVAAGR